MTKAQPRAISQSSVDWYTAKFQDGAADIERWTAAGEIVIVEQKQVVNNGNKN